MGGKVSRGASPMSLAKAQSIVRDNSLVVFSKTYCPYCVKVKKLLRDLGTNPTVLELDVEADGPQLQSAVAGWTGQRTVPSVFIGGEFIGGCDDTVASHSRGKLVPLLKSAGAL
eukprot:TRINITY_DN26380_c0_g1_i1.p1 TRINITY_DN26380_c0_g1~~TRINITY_DN26380_c0_g1_i1.p1  ORF type:complete len:114 (+),score=20.19 TRINITY_DN26380_c0_g1_i1:276-617(+)